MFKLNKYFNLASIPWFDCYVGGFGKSEKPGLSGNMVAGLWGAENNCNEGNFHNILGFYSVYSYISSQDLKYNKY